MRRRAGDFRGRRLPGKRREEGQALVIVAICLVALLGATGLVIDFARIKAAERQLQIAADAAALAGAADLPNGTTAMTTACTYSATDHGAGACNGSALGTDGDNSVGSLKSVSTTTQLECLSVASAGISCVNAPGCASTAGYPPRGSGSNLGCNAIKVTESATVSMSFMNVVGIGSWTVNAASTASMAGGIPQPLDIEMALDSTRSMASSDSCGSGVTGIPTGDTTAEDCAKAGARAFLGALYPCEQSLASCGTVVNGNNPAPLDEVGLMTFPALSGLSTGSGNGVPAETDCVSNVTGSNVTYALNSNFFSSGGTPYSNYQVVPFSSDYRTSSSATSLNNSSNLVNAVYWGSCPGGVYPVNGGAGGSIGGGAANDRSTAVTANGSVAITGGPAAAGDRSSATNGGSATIGGGPATAGNRSTATNGGAATIAGGPGIAGNRSTATVTNQTSISVSVPANQSANSLVLVSVTTLGLHNGDLICPPGPSWTQLPGQGDSGTTNSNRVTTTTFESFRSAKDSGTYQFGFARAGGTCPSPAGGMRSALAASAMAVVYTGVDPASPIDVSAENDSNNNTSGTVTANAVTTNYGGDKVVRVYSSGSTGFNGGIPGVPAGQTISGGGAPVTLILGVADGAQTTATTATTATNSFWVADTIALKPLQGSTSISVPVPANEAAGDLMLVSVNARGLGNNAAICAPDASWQQVPAQSSYPTAGGASSVTVATFESVRGADSQPYVFSFSGDGSCSAASLVSVSASAMAVRYTGVDPASPVDASAVNRNNGTTDTASAVTTNWSGERIARVYGTGGTAFNGGAPGVPAGQSVNNGTVALLGIADGATAGATTATVASADNWVANTIGLKPQQGATSISVPVPANEASGDVVVVSVAARGLGANGAVCPPDASWQNLPAQASQPNGGGASSMTLATFESARGADSGSYVFKFSGDGSCSASSLVPVSASALAVRYAGVDTGAPVDDAPNPNRGTGTTLTSPGVTTSSSGDRVVRVYATGENAFTSGVPAGQAVSNGTVALLGLTDGAASGTAQARIANPGDNWLASSVALQPQQGATSISVPRPNNRADGDLLLVAVTVEGLPANGSICVPTDNTHPWHLIQQDGAANSITQATFYSFRGSSASDSGPYVFNFTAGSNCTGAAALVQGSALAIRYTGVDPVVPIDAYRGAQGSSTHPTPPQVDTNYANDLVVRFYGTTATSISGDAQTVSGSGTSTGYNDDLQAGVGATGSGATITISSADWAADTIALKASSPGCASNCFYGVEDPGGVGTYYADVIAQAQNALVAHNRPGAHPVIILLSDGDATATASALGSAAKAKDECKAAVTAAEAAESPQGGGTWIFSIAYNSSTSGCASDSPPTGTHSISPVCAMHLIADNPETDPSLAGIGDQDWTSLESRVCASNASDSTHRFYNEPAGSSLQGIFQSIGVTLASQRLVSNDAT